MPKPPCGPISTPPSFQSTRESSAPPRWISAVRSPPYPAERARVRGILPRGHQSSVRYDYAMSTAELRRKIKKAVDQLPPKRLESLSDYVQFLNRPPLTERLAAAEKSIASGKGI